MKPQPWPRILWVAGWVLLATMVVHLVALAVTGVPVTGPVSLRSFGERTAAYLGPDPATVGREYPLIRPDTAGGDLVLPHAIGVHGLILLAVPAILLARTARTAARQTRVVAVAVVSVGTGLTVLVVHALRRLPLHTLHPAVLALLGLCVIAYAATLLAVARAVVTTGRARTAAAGPATPPPPAARL